jgi:hypothetical protein
MCVDSWRPTSSLPSRHRRLRSAMRAQLGERKGEVPSARTDAGAHSVRCMETYRNVLLLRHLYAAAEVYSVMVDVRFSSSRTTMRASTFLRLHNARMAEMQKACASPGWAWPEQPTSGLQADVMAALQHDWKPAESKKTVTMNAFTAARLANETGARVADAGAGGDSPAAKAGAGGDDSEPAARPALDVTSPIWASSLARRPSSASTT